MAENNRFINKLEHIVNREFILAVQMGKVPGAAVFALFGENPSILAASPAVLWNYPPVLDYSFSTTAAIDSISSDNAGDNICILVSGLDADFNEVSQKVILDGQNKVALTTPLIRHSLSVNFDSTELLGNVYIYEDTVISAGAPVDPTKVRGYIAISEQISLQGAFTIPAGKTGFLLGLSASLTKKKSGLVVITGNIRLLGGVFTVPIKLSLSTDGLPFAPFLATASSVFPEKTDFKGMADVEFNDMGVGFTFDFLQLDNEVFGLS